MVISCIVSALQNIEQFCGFVERKIRKNLENFDEQMEDTVEYSHIWSEKEEKTSKRCPKAVLRRHGTQFR